MSQHKPLSIRQFLKENRPDQYQRMLLKDREKKREKRMKERQEKIKEPTPRNTTIPATTGRSMILFISVFYCLWVTDPTEYIFCAQCHP